MVGPGKLFDPAHWCVIGINALGSCYGSTGPASAAPDGAPYASRFPIVGVGDMVQAQRRALHKLGIERIAVAIGGSLGGMQALTWALEHGSQVDHAIIVGAYDAFSAMGIGFNAVARQAIYNDPEFAGGDYPPDVQPTQGVRLARMIAMLTYKSDVLFETRFGNRLDRAGGDPARNRSDRFDVEGYLAYQGDIFAKRMDANAYLSLTRAMDLFDVRDCVPADRTPRLSFVGIENDWLFPRHYVERAAARYAALGYECTYRTLADQSRTRCFSCRGRGAGRDSRARLALRNNKARVSEPRCRRVAGCPTTGCGRRRFALQRPLLLRILTSLVMLRETRIPGTTAGIR